MNEIAADSDRLPEVSTSETETVSYDQATQVLDDPVKTRVFATTRPGQHEPRFVAGDPLGRAPVLHESREQAVVVILRGRKGCEDDADTLCTRQPRGRRLSERVHLF